MYAIYSSEQLDGIASASIIYRYARLRKAEAKIAGFLNYATINQDFAKIKEQTNNIIFILDISPEQIQNLDTELQKIAQKNKIFYWNCHHPYNAKTLEIIKKYTTITEFTGKLINHNINKQELCSAEMTYQKFLPNDKIAQELKNIARDIEFWQKKDERSIKLTDVINSGFEKKEIIEILSRGVFWSSRFDKIREEYLEKRQKAFMELISTTKLIKYIDKTFAFSLSPNTLSTADAGERILNQFKEVEISITIYRNCKISLRKRNNCETDLSEIAKLFDGGGHNYAAGGIIKEFKSCTNENFNAIINFIDRKLKNYFLK